jgi:DNA helicase-2/ATP-dependent DNA helicase PcrA
MDYSSGLNDLNDAQRAAVSAPLCNLLVLAGAGSGKTRVLVHRIAWLIREAGASPFGILAVTFTNKAAAEMRGRIESLLGTPVQGMWVGTFHGLAHRLLRAHWQEAGLPQTFQILDSDDQYRLVRRVIVGLGLDEDRWTPKSAQYFINAKKDEGLRPQSIPDYGHPETKTLTRIYQAYEEACARGGLVDFAELLLRSHELWLNNTSLLEHYQQRFPHLLVDEFQDTNTTQYAWIRLLAGKTGRVMIVGDDDQSIYGWRGAKIENIQRFSKDFPETQVIRLEQNYRSTGTILAAANALIANNDGRLGKQLWTSDGAGELISVYEAFNEIDEARFIVEKIQAWEREGHPRREVAILYRSNAQSRVLEEALIQQGVPYRVYGGLRFFDRAEIKDALAYLRLVANRDDDAAFERIVNTPPRGIGDQTLELLRVPAREKNISLWASAQSLLENKQLPGRATHALSRFIQQIDEMDADTKSWDLGAQAEHVLRASGLFDHFAKERGEKAQARIDNLEELLNATQQYHATEMSDLSPLAAFLAHTVLESGEGQAEAYEDSIQLMTLHAAKGLEFPLVFVAGLEEGLFPHPMSLDDEGSRLEEERRLCYVGMTRAMRKLYLTHAECRSLHGSTKRHRPSRFIHELPKDLLEKIRMRTQVSRPFLPRTSAAASTDNNMDEREGLRLGQHVSHAKFGEGVITAFDGGGEHARVHVKFRDHGVKQLVLALAKLVPM